MERYDVSYQQIYGWVRKKKKDGAEGLRGHHDKGKDSASMSEVENCAQLKLKEVEDQRL